MMLSKNIKIISKKYFLRSGEFEFINHDIEPRFLYQIALLNYLSILPQAIRLVITCSLVSPKYPGSILEVGGVGGEIWGPDQMNCSVDQVIHVTFRKRLHKVSPSAIMKVL